MLEIPVAKNTDVEDVVWGLQTADTLWRRGERIDALVWLRRAAQAAGDANDDDRALELARYAAELTEWMASQPSGLDDDEPPREDTEESDSGRPGALSVPPAEIAHAGMFDPWSESQQTNLAPPPAPRGVLLDADENEEEEGVVTSVRPPHAMSSSAPARMPSDDDLPPLSAIPISSSQLAPPPKPVRPAKPPPLPPRARPKTDSESVEVEIEIGSLVPSEPTPTPLVEPDATEPALPEAPPQPSAPEISLATESNALSLEDVEAFADLPDDARVAFAAAADIHQLEEGEEASSFGLAYVLEGTFDVAATVVDAPAARLPAGGVLRARGSTEEGVPMRLIASKGKGVVATWSDEDVERAFRTCPWVEEDLRAAADKVQTLVGITIGPLGERLDVAIREDIVGRLTMRPLSPGEVVVTAGEPVPGLLLVGIGELELVTGDKVAGVVGCGDFLFPTEVLGGGSAPSTARAGKGGALVMFGDRRIAQELLVTCPPLLEVFAGM